MIKQLKRLVKTSEDLKKLYSFISTKRFISQRKNVIENYFGEHSKEARLHLGCGVNVLAGWLNTDFGKPKNNIIYLDVTQPFPFKDNSFSYILAEHLIEHIHYKDAHSMIKECYRVLKPGGVIRISTPDIHKYINITLSKDPFDIKVANTFTDQWIRPGFHNAKNYVPPKDYSNPIFFLNDIFLNYDHKFIYDFDTLKLLLEEHSFTSVEKGVAGISKFAALHNKETHTDEANTYITLTVEGRKP